MKKIISLIVAGMIAEHTGGELFHVETVTVYPDEYNDLIECLYWQMALGRR